MEGEDSISLTVLTLNVGAIFHKVCSQHLEEKKKTLLVTQQEWTWDFNNINNNYPWSNISN